MTFPTYLIELDSQNRQKHPVVATIAVENRHSKSALLSPKVCTIASFDAFKYLCRFRILPLCEKSYLQNTLVNSRIKLTTNLLRNAIYWTCAPRPDTCFLSNSRKSAKPV